MSAGSGRPEPNEDPGQFTVLFWGDSDSWSRSRRSVTGSPQEQHPPLHHLAPGLQPIDVNGARRGLHPVRATVPVDMVISAGVASRSIRASLPLMSKMFSRTLSAAGKSNRIRVVALNGLGWFCARTSRTAAATVGGDSSRRPPRSCLNHDGYARLSDEAVFDEARRVQTVCNRFLQWRTNYKHRRHSGAWGLFRSFRAFSGLNP